MDKFEEEYHKKLLLLSKQEISYKEKYELAKEKIESIKRDENLDRKERRLELAIIDMNRRADVLQSVIGEKVFLRPGSEELEEEKNYVYYNFSSKLRSVLDSNSTLCFHGCSSLVAIHEIIKSGNLSSSVDRLGYSTSYDVGGQVSVTTIDTIETTINGYAGLDNPSFLPAGAVFVITPKDEAEVESSRSLLIGNVNFRDNPDRLVSIITTSENKKRIADWCKQSSLPENIVYTYDEFLDYAIELNRSNVVK